MSDNTQIVQNFIAAWNDVDLEAIMAYFASDAVYHNIPMEEARGVDAIRSLIAGFVGMATAIDWRVHQIAETSRGTVLTERTDRFEVAGRWIEIRVMGTFELAGGKITAWRDYFDLAPSVAGARPARVCAPEKAEYEFPTHRREHRNDLARDGSLRAVARARAARRHPA